MKLNNLKKTLLVSAFGLVTLLGTSQMTSAQNRQQNRKQQQKIEKQQDKIIRQQDKLARQQQKLQGISLFATGAGHADCSIQPGADGIGVDDDVVSDATRDVAGGAAGCGAVSCGTTIG